MKIKLHDRVEHKDGRTGTVVGEEEPMKGVVVEWDDDRLCDYACPESLSIIGHRYFVDTPFTIGETYETKGLSSPETVVGVGLICENQFKHYSHRAPDGRHLQWTDCMLTLPAKPEPSCDGKTVEIDGKKYRLTPVEDD